MPLLLFSLAALVSLIRTDSPTGVVYVACGILIFEAIFTLTTTIFAPPAAHRY